MLFPEYFIFFLNFFGFNPNEAKRSSVIDSNMFLFFGLCLWFVFDDFDSFLVVVFVSISFLPFGMFDSFLFFSDSFLGFSFPLLTSTFLVSSFSSCSPSFSSFSSSSSSSSSFSPLSNSDVSTFFLKSI